MAESIEDQEDPAVFRTWLADRAAERVTAVSLDEVECEWLADGSLSS
jgi:hypothetical protein